MSLAFIQMDIMGSRDSQIYWRWNRGRLASRCALWQWEEKRLPLFPAICVREGSEVMSHKCVWLLERCWILSMYQIAGAVSEEVCHHVWKVLGQPRRFQRHFLEAAKPHSWWKTIAVSLCLSLSNTKQKHTPYTHTPHPNPQYNLDS